MHMAESAFLRIKSSEVQAQILIKDAQDEAAQIIKRAEEEVAFASTLFPETCRQQAVEKKSQAEKDAYANSLAFTHETEEQCLVLKQRLLSQKRKAIQEIIEHIAG